MPGQVASPPEARTERATHAVAGITPDELAQLVPWRIGVPKLSPAELAHWLTAARLARLEDGLLVATRRGRELAGYLGG